jgi:glycosyltransferase involved in cell wall biosynthesis
MMKIIIAAWHLKDFNVGIGRYTRGLIEALGRVDQENEYEILMPHDAYRFPLRPNMRYRVIRFPVFKRRFWEQAAPLCVGPCDVLHLPYDSCVAWKRGKLVTTIHDVKPLLFDSLRPKRTLRRTLEQALVGDKWRKIDHVLTDSECSRRDIVRLLGVPEKRLSVVYPGIDVDQFRPAGASPPHLHLSPCGGEGWMSGRPYVLCVAGADPTKNVETLVEAFAQLSPPVREAHDLVLVGDFRRRDDLRDLVARVGLEKQTVFTGVVNDDRLIGLYQRAALFVFPSRYEGFGLPVLEAMACGCPVISSNASSLPEVAGDAAILLDPEDVSGFARNMETVVTDPGLRDDLRRKGLAQAGRFPWDRTARETIAVYKKVIEG